MAERDKYHIISFVCGLYKEQSKQREKIKTETDSQIHITN